MGLIKTICAVAFLAYLWTNLFPSCSGQDKVANNKLIPPQSSLVEEAHPEKEFKSLGMTPEQFRVAFNRIIGEVSTDFKIAELDIKFGEATNTFNRMIGKHIGMLGSVNKGDQTISQLMLIFGADGASKEDALQFISVLLASTMALNPDIDKEKNSQIISSMVANAINNPNRKNESKYLGKLKYLASYIDVIGLTFYIDSATQ